MPSRTNGRRVRVPLVRCCSVRQYAYQDIRGLSTAGQRQTCFSFRDNAFSFWTREERAVVDAQTRVQPHLNSGESRNATLSWHPVSGIALQACIARPLATRAGIAKKIANPIFKMRLALTLTQVRPKQTRYAMGPTAYWREMASADSWVAASSNPARTAWCQSTLKNTASST